VSSVAFSPDGTKLLTGSVDDTARLWHAATKTDFNRDGDVDLVDFGAFQACFNGPNRGRPWGEAAWVERTAQRLGLAFTLRNPGRPPKRKQNE